MKIFLGKDIETEEPIHLDFEGARAILVCGKRGSGKSYTLGVFVEELLAAGQSDIIPISNRSNGDLSHNDPTKYSPARRTIQMGTFRQSL